MSFRWVALALGAGLLAPAAAATPPGVNGALAFQRTTEIWLVDPDGGHQRRIDVGRAARDPAFSPDGSRVVYEQGRDLVITTTGGRGTQPVTAGGHNDQFPSFSPDGRRIVFHRGDDYDLYTVRVDGSGLRRITFDGATNVEHAPEWSPDGTRIAYEQPGCDPGDEAGYCIYTIATDGTGRTNLTPERYPQECPDVAPGLGAYGNSLAPTWSPDGTQIAYQGTTFHCDDVGPTSGRDIWVMNADGSGKRDITPDQGDRTYDEEPTWSPDGRLIAFQSDRLNGGSNGPRDLVVMPAGGLAEGPAVRVAAAGDPDPQPSWGPRPRAILGTLVGDLLRGTGAADVIRGLAGDDVIRGLAGNDRLDGGPGANRYVAGAGNDRVKATNSARDKVSCGPGRDTVRADRRDRLKGCEVVRHR